jgi:hypothetical protein
MRSVVRSALIFGALAGAGLVWSGCEAKKQTEYVAGISTQVVVPRDLKSIVVNVSVGGVLQFCQAYRVYDGRVHLPRSLGEIPASGKPGPDPITVTVVGFTEELTDTSQNPVFNDCLSNVAKVNENKARILRRSRQPYVENEILFLPMPLKFSCYDKDCGAGEETTCKAGRCESATTDETTLPRFSPDLIDGTGGSCFSATECFAAAVPAVLVDPNDCTYALPNTPSAPALAPDAPANPITSTGEGINVEITYDGGYNREILDKDPVEGFLVPDPAKPQRFRLAPGLCDMVKGVDPGGIRTPHRITAVRASGICRAKGQFQPLCADDQLAAMGTPLGVSPNAAPNPLCKPTELEPAKSALMILADDTENNAIFYAAEGGGASDIAQSDVLGEALADPAFSNTFIGLTFFPGSAGAACGPHNVDVPPLVSRDARPQITAKFASLKPAGTRKPSGALLNMRGALNDTYTALMGIPDVNRRAVLIIGNRSFDTVDSCGGGLGTPADRSTLARTVDNIDTYVGLFARDNSVPKTDPPPVIPGAVEVSRAGEPGAAAPRFFDARKDKREAANALRKIIDDLATCAYDDVPVNPGDDAVLTYSDPVAIPGPQKVFHSITHDAACTGDGAAANGWGYNATTKRVHVCGQACDDYRQTLRTAAGYAQQYGQPSLAVPVFAHSADCAPK